MRHTIGVFDVAQVNQNGVVELTDVVSHPAWFMRLRWCSLFTDTATYATNSCLCNVTSTRQSDDAFQFSIGGMATVKV